MLGLLATGAGLAVAELVVVDRDQLPLTVQAGSVSLMEIDANAVWYDDVEFYRLDEITRVDFGGGYEEALVLALKTGAIAGAGLPVRRVFLADRDAMPLSVRRLTLTLEAIRRYHWPGNVRELSNAIERAAILCEGNLITPELLAIDHRVGSTGPAADLGDKLSLEEYFRVFVLEHQDRMTETELANALGISRKTLWERRQRFGLPRQKKRG